jgi:RNA polymerase sigma-70 factor (ECF subfamily)
MGRDGRDGDEELIEELAASATAFEAFYRRHVAGVTRFLAGRCRTADDVADATASTFLAVLVSSHTYDPQLGSPTSWLYAIARNEAHGQLRAFGRHEALRLRLCGRRLLSPDDAERIAEMIDAERDVARLRPVIDSASASERAFLEHMVAEDLTPAATASMLGISPGAGRVRLTRLRERIRNSAERVPHAIPEDRSEEDR